MMAGEMVIWWQWQLPEKLKVEHQKVRIISLLMILELCQSNSLRVHGNNLINKFFTHLSNYNGLIKWEVEVFQALELLILISLQSLSEGF
jgi:hypothetical protein